MKIIISCLAFDEGKSGISDYIISVVRVMLEKHEVTLIIHPSDALIFPLKSSNLNYIYVSEWIKHPLISMLWHLYVLPFSINFKQYDLVFLPAGNRRLLARYPSHTVVTIHDLSQFHVPFKYDLFRMFYIKRIIPHYLRKAPKIYAISENTKNDLIRYYNLPPQNIEVNYNGYDKTKLFTGLTLEDLQQRFKIRGKYLLYVARIEHPGKNHLNLLKAYNLLPQSIKSEYDLVCPGSFWSGHEVVLHHINRLDNPDHVHFPGFVNNSEVAGLYKYAALYIFPSLYEGFGIPLLEAFACGIPVICSDRSSLPEIGGDAVLTFNPLQPEDIAEKVTLVLHNPELQSELISNGYKRLDNFSWVKHTEKIINTFKE